MRLSKLRIFNYLTENKRLALGLLNGRAWQVHNGRGHQHLEAL
jgi:hypothetical protein